MVENSGKFHAIFIKRKNKSNNNSILKIKKKSKTQKFVTLPGIKIDDKLNFKKLV